MPRCGVQIALRTCDFYGRSCVFLANRLESSYACRQVKIAPSGDQVGKETLMVSRREQASKSTYLLPSEVARARYHLKLWIGLLDESAAYLPA